MAIVIPETFTPSSLTNDAERDVVRACVDQLDDAWFVVPNVGISGPTRDYQLDVVLLHRDFGILDIEVKGHRPRIAAGVWMSGSTPMEPQPPAQAQTNAYALRDLLRVRLDDTRLRVEWAVAFPNVSGIAGDLPPGVDPVQVIDATALSEIAERLEMLLARRSVHSLGQDVVEAIVAELCPSAQFIVDPMARSRAARDRLDTVAASQIAVAAELDANPRVVVTGAAGTGKSGLVAKWAQRAYSRGDRVLVTCFNEPLAAELTARLPEDDTMRVGAFLPLALELPGMPPLIRTESSDRDYWEHEVPHHLATNWDHVTERFDTIVVDEAQDFSPDWLGWLEGLLDPDQPGRLLLVADPAQTMHDRGFAVPEPGTGWTLGRLVTNCRNTLEIAALLRRQLSGASAPTDRPNSAAVRWHRAQSGPELAQQVGRLVADIQGTGQFARTLVLTPRARDRDALRVVLGWGRWEDAGVPCETVHRVKGVEADAVVIVSPDGDVSDTELYVAVSRAVLRLDVVGPESLARRLKLPVDAT